MKKVLVIVAVAMMGASSQAIAQVAPATSDPAKLQLAREIVEASGGEKAAENRITALYATVGKGMAAQIPAGQGRLAEAFQADLAAEMTPLVPQILDVSVHAYADVFSEQELKDWLAFQRSESGQAISRKSPLVTQRALTAMMPLILKVMPGVMQRTMNRVCVENHCTQQQQQIVADAVKKAMSKPS